jgi:hypothetical protein
MSTAVEAGVEGAVELLFLTVQRLLRYFWKLNAPTDD